MSVRTDVAAQLPLAAIPARERVITCEELFELRLLLADVVAMQTRQPDLESLNASTRDFPG